jgi:predicted methyltransferase
MKYLSFLWTSALLALASCGGAPSSPSGPAAPSQPAPAAGAAETPAATDPTAATDPILAAVSAPRDPADASRDELRQPAALLRFSGVAPGMRVADLGSGPGYTGHLLAHVVGAGGKVYAQNPRQWADFSWPDWEKRKASGDLSQVELVERPFDDPLPPDVRDLDVVFSILIYHDTAYMGVARAKMNAAVFAALAPGGTYTIVDHAAARGAGTTVAQTLHRIEKDTVIREVQAAGFELVEEGDFLRHESDDHTGVAWADPQPVTDRFVLKFRKPAR